MSYAVVCVDAAAFANSLPADMEYLALHVDLQVRVALAAVQSLGAGDAETLQEVLQHSRSARWALIALINIIFILRFKISKNLEQKEKILRMY